MVWARQLASKHPCTVGDFCCSPSASRNATFWTSIPWRSATAKNGASPFRFWLQLEKRSIFGRPKDPRGSTLHEDTRRCWGIGRGETDLRQQLFLKKNFCKWQWRTTGKLIQIQKSHHNHHIFHFASQVSKSSWETCQKSAAASGLPAYPPWICAGSDGFRYQKAPKQSQRWSYSQYQSCIELDTQKIIVTCFITGVMSAKPRVIYCHEAIQCQQDHHAIAKDTIHSPSFSHSTQLLALNCKSLESLELLLRATTATTSPISPPARR